MNDYYAGHDDNAACTSTRHPNRAFFLAADASAATPGRPAKIWYTALCHNLRPSSKFLDAANATVMIAGTSAAREQSAEGRPERLEDRRRAQVAAGRGHAERETMRITFSRSGGVTECGFGPS